MWSRIGGVSISVRLLGFLVLSLISTALLVGLSIGVVRDEVAQQKADATKAVVDVATKVVAGYGERAKSGAMTPEQAKAAALDALRSLRYHETDYFWVQEFDGRVLMHPTNAKIIGLDPSQTKDPSGRPIFIEFGEAARSGGNFVAYDWPKPGSDAPQPKISYVAPYQPWGWAIGSGVYVDDVDAAAKAAGLRLALWGAGIALLSLVLALVVRRSITTPLRQVVDILRRHDLSYRFPTTNPRNELHQLGGALNATLDGMQQVATDVADQPAGPQRDHRGGPRRRRRQGLRGRRQRGQGAGPRIGPRHRRHLREGEGHAGRRGRGRHRHREHRAGHPRDQRLPGRDQRGGGRTTPYDGCHQRDRPRGRPRDRQGGRFGGGDVWPGRDDLRRRGRDAHRHRGPRAALRRPAPDGGAPGRPGVAAGGGQASLRAARLHPEASSLQAAGPYAQPLASR
ncbi:MAG: cache domain-containing protein [Austwickia sp.]|nr:MAG: cache domain-containing protein [Austwickia sp.]